MAEKIKATPENLYNALVKLAGLYNKNMGYNIEVKHYPEDGQIGFFCQNPTMAKVNDVSMVANAFLEDGGNVVEVNDFFGFIEVFYCDTNFREYADTMLLDIVGAL